MAELMAMALLSTIHSIAALIPLVNFEWLLPIPSTRHARAVARRDEESSGTGDGRTDGRTDDGGDGRVDHQAVRVVRHGGVVRHELAGAVLLATVHIARSS
jgi:hypothetical protein